MHVRKTFTFKAWNIKESTKKERIRQQFQRRSVIVDPTFERQQYNTCNARDKHAPAWLTRASARARQVALARGVSERQSEPTSAVARLFLPSVHCGTVTGAKMADNREEISELVEKRGICRRLAPLARREHVAPRTPGIESRVGSREKGLGPRDTSSARARARSRTARRPRACREPSAGRSRAHRGPIPPGLAVRDVEGIAVRPRDVSATAVIVAVMLAFPPSLRPSDLRRAFDSAWSRGWDSDRADGFT